MAQPLLESKLYENYAGAEAAVDRLHALGYGTDSISVIVNPDKLPRPEDQMGKDGALIGGATGGLLGAIVAAGVAIAVTGGMAAPIVAGPLAAMLASVAGGAGAGIVGGSIFGGLLELGMQADDVSNALDHGGVVVTVHLASDDERAKVKAAL
jgi:hypothetical protein